MLKRLREWLAGTQEQGDTATPLDAGDHIDAVALRKDGGVDLVIIARSRLHGSERTQGLLQIKIKKYLQQRNSIAFNAEFHYPPADKVEIVLESDWQPSRAIRSLVRQLEPFVRANHACISICSQKARKPYLRQLLHQQYPLIQPRLGGGTEKHPPSSYA